MTENELPIYLDYNASTPIHPEVAKEMIPYLEGITFGNPSSSHIYGKTAKKAVTLARERVSKMLNCSPEEIVFSSGGTESNNFAIRGVFHSLKKKFGVGKKIHFITSSIEHPSIREVANYLQENFGARITFLSVDKFGLINLEELESSICEQTFLVSIMHSNNVVGTIQPISEISKICKKHGVLFHTDSVQSIGKVRIDVEELGVDMLTICGHKFYGPKGVGCLYVRKGVKLERLIHGAPHENKLRAGTENVLELVGLGKACELVTKEIDERMKKMKQMRDILHERILKGLGDDASSVVVNGHPELKLCNTLSISFPGLIGNDILEKIGDQVAASAGAACHSGTVKVSGTLKAMNVPEKTALGTLRLSVGIFTSIEDIMKSADIISSTVMDLKEKN